MKFSERMGYTKPKDVIQNKSVDSDLKNDLWNILYVRYFDEPIRESNSLEACYTGFHQMFVNTWIFYLKQKINDIPFNPKDIATHIQGNFFSERSPWYLPYEIIEFIYSSFSTYYTEDLIIQHRKETEELFNLVLSQNISGYRFINGLFVAITNEQEIQTLKDALINNDEYSTVTSHLNKAISLLSDKNAPDFSNSIKESVSAIESYFKVFFQKPTISFGDALNNLEHKHGLDKQIKDSINKIYGYCNNKGAIRHGLHPGDTTDKITVAEAKYMLVTCSAFINYLKETSTK